jgi:hypothetical protein
MIGAYMDESFDRPNQPGVFVVGGFLGRGVAIFELERRWESLLKRSDVDIAYFKAVECERGTGEFAKFVVDPFNKTSEEISKLRSIHSEFLSLIKAPVQGDSTPYLPIFGVGTVQKDFYGLLKSDPKAEAVLGRDPFRLTYSLAMIQCAWAMKQIGTGDFVSFVCDEHEQYSPLAASEYPSLKANNPEAAQYMATFSYSDEKNGAPLQAADLLVYELRRAFNVHLNHRPGEHREQFTQMKNGIYYLANANKENLMSVLERSVPGEPFRMDELMNMQFDYDIKF